MRKKGTCVIKSREHEEEKTRARYQRSNSEGSKRRRSATQKTTSKKPRWRERERLEKRRSESVRATRPYEYEWNENRGKECTRKYRLKSGGRSGRATGNSSLDLSERHTSQRSTPFYFFLEFSKKKKSKTENNSKANQINLSKD